jgi:membrane-bound ClpP family serine protease
MVQSMNRGSSFGTGFRILEREVGSVFVIFIVIEDFVVRVAIFCLIGLFIVLIQLIARSDPQGRLQRDAAIVTVAITVAIAGLHCLTTLLRTGSREATEKTLRANFVSTHAKRK